MGDLDFDALIRFVKANPWFAGILVYFIAAFLRAITRGAKGNAAKQGGARPPERRVADADLQERVRSGFEQMMRERAAGRTAAAATGAPTKRALRPPTPAPVKPPAIVRVKAAASAAPARMSLQARSRIMRRTSDEASASRARRLLIDRSSLRSAVLASEILGKPLALRDPR